MRDDKVHIKYVPTQVVTEFVRHLLKGAQGEPLDGILYRSSRARVDSGGHLADPEQCGPRERERPLPPNYLLLFSSVRYASPDELRYLWPAN